MMYEKLNQVLKMMDEEKLKLGYSPRAACVICGADTGMVEDGKPHICANCHSNEECIEAVLGVALA